MEAIGVWRHGHRTDVSDGRGHEVTLDLPPDEGGGDVGTSALELAVMSLAGCITTIFAIVARKRRLPIRDFRIDLHADGNGAAPPLRGVNGTLRVWTDAPRDEVGTALRVTLRTCPVGVLFSGAGIPVDVRLEVIARELPLGG